MLCSGIPDIGLYLSLRMTAASLVKRTHETTGGRAKIYLTGGESEFSFNFRLTCNSFSLRQVNELLDSHAIRKANVVLPFFHIIKSYVLTNHKELR